MRQSKLARQDRADQRQADRDARTDTAQLKRLDKINGKGKGAKKERARLAKRISTTESARVEGYSPRA